MRAADEHQQPIAVTLTQRKNDGRPGFHIVPINKAVQIRLNGEVSKGATSHGRPIQIACKQAFIRVVLQLAEQPLAFKVSPSMAIDTACPARAEFVINKGKTSFNSH